MRAFVFTDQALARHAGRFVWLDVDIDKVQNAKFLEQFPVDSFPTLLVIDPRGEQPMMRWLGDVSVPQLVGLLDQAETAYRGHAQGYDAQLAEADRLFGAGQPELAVRVLEKLLQQAPAEWAPRSRAVETAVNAYESAKDNEGCATVGANEAAKLPRNTHAANALKVALRCAVEIAQAPVRERLLHTLVPAGEQRLHPPPADMAADDRYELYESLVDGLKALNDRAGAKALAREWMEAMDAAANAIADPAARSALDSDRMNAYEENGELARAIPMLQQSERALPNDYNPPARLAYVFRKLGRLDEALAATDRALPKVYGPRKLRVLELRAEIFADRGETAKARDTIDQALAVLQSLPASQQPKTAAARLKARREKLGGAPPAGSTR